MKLAITLYPDDFAEADRIIHQLRGVRSLELDTYMGKAQYEKTFDKPYSQTAEEAEREEMNAGPSLGITQAVPRENMDPGFTACSRIGSDTKEALLKNLPTSDPDHLAKKIKRTGEQTRQLLQLLWDRGEIRYDGRDFHV